MFAELLFATNIVDCIDLGMGLILGVSLLVECYLFVIVNSVVISIVQVLCAYLFI